MTTSNNESDKKAQQESVNEIKTPSSNKVKTKKKLKIGFLIPLVIFIGLVAMLYMRLGKPTIYNLISMIYNLHISALLCRCASCVLCVCAM